MATLSQIALSTSLAAIVALAASPALANAPPPLAPAGARAPEVLPAAAATLDATDPNQPVNAIPEAPPPEISETALPERPAYARAGTRELGASAGLTVATGFRNVNVAPTIGWFVTDHVELSGILAMSNIKAGEHSSTVWSALFEPSYHVPIEDSLYWFLGMGLGVAYIGDLGGGLAVAPRIGLNFLVGRSGVLTPSLSYEYTTHTVDNAMNGEDITLGAVSSTVRVNIGYTAMW